MKSLATVMVLLTALVSQTVSAQAIDLTEAWLGDGAPTYLDPRLNGYVGRQYNDDTSTALRASTAAKLASDLEYIREYTRGLIARQLGITVTDETVIKFTDENGREFVSVGTELYTEEEYIAINMPQEEVIQPKGSHTSASVEWDVSYDINDDVNVKTWGRYDTKNNTEDAGILFTFKVLEW